MTVSADGNTLTTNWMYYLSPSGGPVTDTDSQTRVEKRQQVHTRFQIPGGRPSRTSLPRSADFQRQDLRRRHSEHDDSDRPVLYCEARRYGSSIRRRPWNYDCVAQAHRRMTEGTEYLTATVNRSRLAK